MGDLGRPLPALAAFAAVVVLTGVVAVGQGGGEMAVPVSAPAPASTPASAPASTSALASAVLAGAASGAGAAAASGPGGVRGPRCRFPASVRRTLARTRPPQILLITARGTTARVNGCTRVPSRGRYERTLGPFTARVGHRSVAPAGRKREGDGRTPAGVFPLGTGFGSDRNPGLDAAFGWFRAGRADVWVDDPPSRLYNSHQRRPVRGRWRSAERLRIRPYRIAQVIGYNQERRPGRGSAVFLHVGTGGPTAGCVSLPLRRLRAVLRWERPGAVIGIARRARR